MSIVGAEVARQARRMHIRPTEDENEIHLVDGTRASIPGHVTLPVTIQGRTIRHSFSILPSLDGAMLIGIDLWGRLGLAIPPPPSRTQGRTAKRCTVGQNEKFWFKITFSRNYTTDLNNFFFKLKLIKFLTNLSWPIFEKNFSFFFINV